MLNSISQVSKKLNISIKQINIVLELLKDGSTVPFIARYRQAQTMGLNEEEIQKINNEYQYTIELNKRKESIINLLDEKGLLNEKLKNAILFVDKKSELENIYEPFKQGKKTKASDAIALGLEPFAKLLFLGKNDINPKVEAKKYLNDKVTSVEFAIEQSKFIIAQWMSQDIEARTLAKIQLKQYGHIISKLKKGAKDEKRKFQLYYDHKELIKTIPNHRIMSINRGEDLKILKVDIEYNEKKVKYDLNNYFFKNATTGKIILDSLEDSLKRLIIPSIKREIRKELFERASEASIKLFANNLEEMLLSPAIKEKIVLAIDPAFYSGCKIAVLNPMGDVLKIDLFKPTAPHNKIKESAITLNSLIDKYNVDIIVIGNGTASRETEAFVASVLKERNDKIPFAIVSEVGASVYSASDIAIKEFPNLSVEQRSAINIGRRFQDPLNELIKIDPKSIGIGQYQHDVNQKDLAKSLEFKVNKVVNQVGVDINTASSEILSYIAGVSKRIAENIIDYRHEIELFKNRKEIKKVKGLGPKAYNQAIGFLRIHESKIFYDRTQIHPESYKLAESVVDVLEIDLNNINKDILKKVNLIELAEKLNSNEYDIKIIIDSLLAPGKDIREERDAPILKTEILKMENLKEGMQLEGSVQNITDFGAFIYIGIKQAALVHKSKMADKYVSHPSEILKTGQRVTIEIISIEPERERIQAKLIN